MWIKLNTIEELQALVKDQKVRKVLKDGDSSEWLVEENDVVFNQVILKMTFTNTSKPWAKRYNEIIEENNWELHQ